MQAMEQEIYVCNKRKRGSVRHGKLQITKLLTD